MITNEEWDALPEEEKKRRKELFEMELRRILARYEKDVCVTALKATLKEVKNGTEG